MSVRQNLQLRTSPVMVVETPSCTATNTDEVICMNIVKHIARLLKSDAFLVAVCGVWMCSMIALGAML